MSQDLELSVRNNRRASQYELFADGERLGFAQYQESPKALAFVHTEIAPEVGGGGLGGVLVRSALDDARDKGLAVLPYCTFVLHFIDTHREYLDLVPDHRRHYFGLPTDAEAAASPAGSGE
jgi:predicted GNAT family acetyltransferase